MNIKELQDEIINDFELFDDWEGKYEYIIDLGKKMPPLSDEFKTDENIIKGCQSVVWLRAFYEDGKVFFEGDSQAIIVKGLVNMLLKVLSGHKPEEILHADLFFIDKSNNMNVIFLDKRYDYTDKVLDVLLKGPSNKDDSKNKDTKNKK